jgi:hypothetical protein
MEPQLIIKSSRAHRVLAVADWDLDPHAIVSAMLAHDDGRPSVYELLVPAGLHGLDWAGEPSASMPCAQRQLARLEQLLDDAGVRVEIGQVGDPVAGAAISDAFYDRPADEILLFARHRRLRISHPLGLASRIERATGVPVTRLRVPASHRRGLRTTPQCVAARALK